MAIIARFSRPAVPIEQMTSLLSQGTELMLVGMGTVFVFLTLLVFATTWMSWLVNKIAPVPVGVALRLRESAAEAEELAAISAAIHLHRARQQQPDTQGK